MKLLPSHHTTMHYVTSCEGACVFSCNQPPVPLAEWPRSFKSLCYCGNPGVKWMYQSKSQHRKLTLEKKIHLALLQGLRPVTFQSWVQHSDYWAIPTPPWAVPLCVDFESMLAKICAFSRLSRKNIAHLTVIEQCLFCWCWKHLWSQLCSWTFVSHSRTTKACQSHWHQENPFFLALFSPCSMAATPTWSVIMHTYVHVGLHGICVYDSRLHYLCAQFAAK